MSLLENTDNVFMLKNDVQKVYAVTVILTVACVAWKPTEAAMPYWMTLAIVTFAAWFWSVAIDWVQSQEAE